LSDPHDDNHEPKPDQQFSSGPDEQNSMDELDVRAEDADKVKGARLDDPYAGGQASKKLL
jgi:hypothetical protein